MNGYSLWRQVLNSILVGLDCGTAAVCQTYFKDLYVDIGTVEHSMACKASLTVMHHNSTALYFEVCNFPLVIKYAAVPSADAYFNVLTGEKFICHKTMANKDIALRFQRQWPSSLSHFLSFSHVAIWQNCNLDS